MFFRYDGLDNENFNEEEFYPCEACPFLQCQYRMPVGNYPPPSQGGQYYPPQGGQNYPPQGGQNFPPQGGQNPPPPGMGGQGYGHEGGMPTSPPPAHTPQKSYAQPYAVSPGSIRRCTHRFVYIWLKNGRSFWAWLTRVDRRTATGWRWNGRRWVYFGVDLRSIDYFECY